MKNPMISIIVPVYNTAKYLEKCIDSIISQTLNDIEVLIIDDGSTDVSPLICRKYASADSRIKYFRIENSGPSYARNFGLKKVSGDYVMFVDSDDWIEENACAALLFSAKENNADYVIGAHVNESTAGSTVRKIFSRSMVFDGNSFKEEVLLPTLGPKGTKMNDFGKIDRLTPIWARLYRTSIVKENGIEFIDLKKLPSECLQFNFDFCFHSTVATYIDTVVYHYRRNTGMSVTKPYRDNLLNKWQWWYEYFENKYGEPLQNAALANSFRARICSSIIPLGGNAMKLKRYSLIKKECQHFLNDVGISNALNEADFSRYKPHWKLFFYSAKNRRVNLFIFLTKIMRLMLSRRKK